MSRSEKNIHAQTTGFRDFAIALLIASAVSFAFSLMGWFSVAEEYLAERSLRMTMLLSVVVLLHGYLCMKLPVEVECGVSRRRGIFMLVVNVLMTVLCVSAFVAEKSGAAEIAHLLTGLRALPSLLLMLLAIRARQLEPKPESRKSLFEDKADALLERQQKERKAADTRTKNVDTGGDER